MFITQFVEVKLFAIIFQSFVCKEKRCYLSIVSATLDTSSASPHQIVRISKEKFVICSFALTYFTVNFTIVLRLLKNYCSSHFVSVFMVYHRGGLSMQYVWSVLKPFITNVSKLFLLPTSWQRYYILLDLGLSSFGTTMRNVRATLDVKKLNVKVKIILLNLSCLYLHS